MSRTLPMAVAINEALHVAMDTDPTVIVLGEDVAGGGGRQDQGIDEAWGGIMRATRGPIGRFGPGRVRDTPISEMGFRGAAVGAAATGHALLLCNLTVNTNRQQRRWHPGSHGWRTVNAKMADRMS